MSPKTMRAVVFKGPYQVALEERPVPTIQEPGDIIVEVKYTALCGSELHVFRGHQPSPTGFIMGHEFTGTVVEAGEAVKTIKVGDKIVAPFTLSCGECFYCQNSFSSRCAKSRLFGSEPLDGGQAQYVRVPLADGTVMKAPDGIDDERLVLMADIFPTGYFAARNGLAQLSETQRANATVVVVGCGPVGLCAVIAAASFKPKHLFAVDSVPSRLELAKGLGAEPLNFQTEPDKMKERIKEVTEGRGADVVLEVVGLSPALRLGFDLLRPWGIISSVGVHNKEVPWTAAEGYHKNVRVQMGRCPVRSIFPESLELLRQEQDKLGFMADKILPLSQALEGYELFDKMKAQKVIFEAQK